MDTLLNIRISKTLKKTFQTYCNESSSTMASEIRRFIYLQTQNPQKTLLNNVLSDEKHSSEKKEVYQSSDLPRQWSDLTVYDRFKMQY